MKSILSKLAARYQGKKLFTTLGAYALGGYLISKGHTELGTGLIAIAQGTYNVGQGVADSKPDAVRAVAAARIEDAIERLVIPRQD